MVPWADKEAGNEVFLVHVVIPGIARRTAERGDKGIVDQ